MEEWRSIRGLEALYEVSSLGRVRNARTGYVRKLRLGTDPKMPRPAHYLGVGDDRKWYFVHTVALEAFVGPRPPGMEGCHNNGDSQDNRIENLRWDTSSENKVDTVRHGSHHLAKRDQCSKGHRLEGDNVRRQAGRSGRICRACLAESQKKYRANKRLA